MAKGSRAKGGSTKKAAAKKGDSKPKRSKVDDMSDDEKEAEVGKLLKQLEKSDDKAEKRGIRVKLRKLGHTGGLRASKSEDDE